MTPNAPPFGKGQTTRSFGANVKPIVSNERLLCGQRRTVVRQPDQDGKDVSSVSFSASLPITSPAMLDVSPFSAMTSADAFAF